MLEKLRRLQHYQYKSRKKSGIVIFPLILPAPNELNMLKHTLQTQSFQISLAYAFHINFKIIFLNYSNRLLLFLQ